MNKRFVSMFFVLLLALATVSAGSNLKWSWENSENLANYFRYQIDGGEIVETTEKVVYSDFDGKSHTLQVWQSFDGKTWSELGCCTFDPDAAKFAGAKGLFVSVAAAPYTWTNFNYADPAYEDTNSRYGFAMKADGRMQKGWLMAGADARFDMQMYEGVSKNVIGLGVDAYVGAIKTFGKASAYVSVGGGMSFQKIESFHVAPNAFVGIGGEYAVADTIMLKAEVLGRTTFHGHTDSTFAARSFGIEAYLGASKKF